MGTVNLTQPTAVFAAVMTPEKFAAWLEKQPIDRQFPDLGRCPISAYLADVYQTKDVGTGYHYCRIDGQTHDLPEWARRFVVGFDALQHRSTPGVCQRVLTGVMLTMWPFEKEIPHD